MNKSHAVVAITGIAGYLGFALAKLLQDDPRVARIIGIDAKPLADTPSKVQFHRRSITEPGLEDLFVQAGVSHVAHLAFLLAPNHDPRGTREINVGGTRNVLSAAAAAKVQHFAFGSSSVVYGAHPDNPPRIPETYPLRPAKQVQYTLDKVEAESLCEQFHREHPEIQVSILRVVTIIGPRAGNFISRFFQKPVIILPLGYDPPWQFIHETDCARAFQAALFSERSGTYNLGADEPLRFSEIVAKTGRPVLRLPHGLLKFTTNCAWGLRLKLLTEIPGALIDYLCFPPVLDNDRLKRDLEFEFQYTSREAIFSFLEAQTKSKPNSAPT